MQGASLRIIAHAPLAADSISISGLRAVVTLNGRMVVPGYSMHAGEPEAEPIALARAVGREGGESVLCDGKRSGNLCHPTTWGFRRGIFVDRSDEYRTQEHDGDDNCCHRHAGG